MAGKVGRLGIGLKANVEVWERELSTFPVIKGKAIEKFEVQQYDVESESPGKDWEGYDRKEIGAWVSDHFGIAIGVRTFEPS